MQGVVDALVDAGLDPAVLVAQLADLRHFPRHVVADAQPLEAAFIVQVVDGLHGDFVGRGAVWLVDCQSLAG